MVQIPGTIKVKIDANPGYLFNEVLKQGVYERYRKGLSDGVKELQSKSYVGASAAVGEPSLKSGWDFISPRRDALTFTVRSSIVNTTPNAFERIVGRGPGKMPPVQSLINWVRIVLGKTNPSAARGTAFAIARRIALSGTRRWRTQQNFLGMTRTGEIKTSGLIAKIEQEIARKVERG